MSDLMQVNLTGASRGVAKAKTKAKPEPLNLEELNEKLKSESKIEPLRAEFNERLEMLVEKLQKSEKFTDKQITEIIARLEDLFNEGRINLNEITTAK